jgi:hypothetical protein
MLLREIITPTQSAVTVFLPEEMVGKTVEVIAFEIGVQPEKTTREERLAHIEAITGKHRVDLRNFKFDRDEANNYDE